jgi:hypothetical protein
MNVGIFILFVNNVAFVHYVNLLISDERRSKKFLYRMVRKLGHAGHPRLQSYIKVEGSHFRYFK